jgi:hypothetical protein
LSIGAYREQLMTNVTNLLGTWFLEPVHGPAVGPEAPPARATLEAARPNPSSANAALRFALPRAGRARLQLVDVWGRRVRTLVDGALGAGPHEAVWDGRSEDGRTAPAGLYWARLEADGAVCVRRVVRLR